MKSFLLCLFVLCTSLSAINVNAQKTELLQGDISAVKSEKTINIEFTYDSMKVGKFRDFNLINYGS